jgi:hypothetical protein
MFGRVSKFFLVISAIAPIGFVYAWVAANEGFYKWATALVIICCLLVITCLALLSAARSQLERFPFTPRSVEAADRENVAFMLLYLSPLFTGKFGSANLTVLIPTIAIFALMTATGYSYHFNPLLSLIGWHFYKVTSTEGVTYVLVTKKQLRSTAEIREVGQLTDYILIDLETSNAG